MTPDLNDRPSVAQYVRQVVECLENSGLFTEVKSDSFRNNRFNILVSGDIAISRLRVRIPLPLARGGGGEKNIKKNKIKKKFY